MPGITLRTCPNRHDGTSDFQGLCPILCTTGVSLAKMAETDACHLLPCPAHQPQPAFQIWHALGLNLPSSSGTVELAPWLRSTRPIRIKQDRSSHPASHGQSQLKIGNSKLCNRDRAHGGSFQRTRLAKPGIPQWRQGPKIQGKSLPSP